MSINNYYSNKANTTKHKQQQQQRNDEQQQRACSGGKVSHKQILNASEGGKSERTVVQILLVCSTTLRQCGEWLTATNPSFPFISLTSFRYFVYTLECVATLLREVGAFDLSRERRFRYSIICSHFMADQFTIKLKLHASLRFNQFVCPSHLAADYHFIASQYKCMEFVSVCR